MYHITKPLENQLTATHSTLPGQISRNYAKANVQNWCSRVLLSTPLYSLVITDI